MNMNKNKINDFIKDPKKALYTLAIPVVISMMVQTLYNVVDTAFVGRLGAEAIAALTFSFPLFFILIAINAGLGAGLRSLISRYMGAKNRTAAANTGLHGILIAFIISLIVVAFGLYFLEPLLMLFGAENQTLVFSMDYLSVILYGVLFLSISAIFGGIFAAQGDTKTPMKVQVSSLILNMILDPIFIYVLDFGVKGAAIATVIAFAYSMLTFAYFLNRKSYLRLYPENFRFSWFIIKDMLRIGTPACLSMVLTSISLMVFNRFMAHFSIDHVAAFGLVWRLGSVALMPVVAVSLSVLTLIGMFFGAKRYDLLRFSISYSMKVTALFAGCVAVIFFAIPQVFFRIFTADQNLIDLASAYIRIDLFGYPLIAVCLIIGRAMQGMGKGFPGMVINLTRMIFVAVPLAYVLVFIFDLSYLSLTVSMVFGTIIGSIVALVWLRKHLKQLNKRRALQENN